MGVYWYVVSREKKESFRLGKWRGDKWRWGLLEDVVRTEKHVKDFVALRQDAELVADTGDLPWDYCDGWFSVGDVRSGFFPVKVAFKPLVW